MRPSLAKPNIQAKEVFCQNMASLNRWVMLACSIIKYRISVIQIFNKGKIIKLILFCYETMSCRLQVVASKTPIFLTPAYHPMTGNSVLDSGLLARDSGF